MLEDRLVVLAVISVEREISQKLSLEDVVNEFHAQDKKQKIVLS